MNELLDKIRRAHITGATLVLDAVEVAMLAALVAEWETRR
jgi:hypothetical protein